MKLLLVATILATTSAPGTEITARTNCEAVIDGTTIRVSGRGRFGNDLPEGDWIPLHDASTSVDCMIVQGGRLDACHSSLRDARGPWIENQLRRRWKISDAQVDGCPVIGRHVRFNFRFDMTWPPQVVTLPGPTLGWGGAVPQAHRRWTGPTPTPSPEGEGRRV